jgi:hypothetical protein
MDWKGFGKNGSEILYLNFHVGERNMEKVFSNVANEI